MWTLKIQINLDLSKIFYATYCLKLRVRAVFFFFFFFFSEHCHQGLPCHVYCNFKFGYTCRIFLELCEMVTILASNNCFSYRNIFQNGVDALPKIVDSFLSKISKYYPVWVKRYGSIFSNLWHKHLLKNYKWHFRLPMSAFATVT